MSKWRFDIVVVNYMRAESFTRNAWRLGRIGSNDRVSFVSASPSEQEASLVRRWAEDAGVNFRYLPRRNRGLAELPRCQYFSGKIGGPENLTESRYIFSMQDHYLDTTSPWSKWGPGLDYRIKGDVVPDDLVFDLDAIDSRMQAEGCVAAFADRNNPCWIEIGKARHIAPSGGNFIVRTDYMARPEVQHANRQLQRFFDDSYMWALYAEFMWGALVFHEGAAVLDIKRDRVFTRFDREDFYVAPDDFNQLRRVYSATPLGALLRAYYRSRRLAGRIARRLRRSKGPSN